MSLFKRKITESETALAELQATFASLSEEHEALKTELQGAHESAATYLAEFTRADALNKEQAAAIEALNASLAEASRDAAEFDDKVSKAAAVQVAQMGHAPLEIVEEEESAPDVVTTFKGLKGKALVEFYNANKQAISGALRGR